MPFLSIAMIAGLAAPVQAERVQYRTDWMIADSLIEAQPALDEAAEIPLSTVNNRDIFMKSRLLPPTAATLSADLLSKKGKVIVAAGSELMGLYSASQKIFCTVGQKGPGAVSMLLMGNAGFKQYCLVDSDSDDRFDSYFKGRSQIKGLPNFRGRTPKKPKPAGDVAYTEIDPAEMNAVYFVGLQYRGNANIKQQHVFEIMFGLGEKTDNLTARLLAKNSELPQSLTPLGGSFTIEDANKDVLKVRINRPFAKRPFGVTQTVTYRYY